MLDDFLVKEEKTKDTTVIEYGTSGNWVKMRKASYKPFLEYMDKQAKIETQAKNRKNEYSSDKTRGKLAYAFTKFLALDWRMTSSRKVMKENFPDIEVTDEKGLDKKQCLIPYTESNAYNILKHKDLWSLLQTMFTDASNPDLFLDDGFEEEVKN